MELGKNFLSEVTQTLKNSNGMYSLTSGYWLLDKNDHATVYRPREA